MEELPFKIQNVSEEPNKKDMTVSDAIFPMTGKEIVQEVLATGDKILNKKLVLDEGLDPNILKPNFKEKHPQKYKKLLRNAELSYKNTKELEDRLVPKIIDSFCNKLSQYLNELGIEHDTEKILNKIKETRVVIIDTHRRVGMLALSMGNFTIGGPSGSESMAFYISRSKTIVVDLSKILKNYRENLEKFKAKDKDTALLDEIINSILRHELVHASSYENYWHVTNVINQKDLAISRRSGIENTPLSPQRTTQLKYLNEAITQQINMKTWENIADENSADFKKEIQDNNSWVYIRERKLLEILTEFADWSYFVSAYFNKKDLVVLNRKLKKNAGFTLKQIDSMMEKDHEENYKEGYKQTIDFLRRRLPVMKKVKYLFHAKNYSSVKID